MSNIDITNVITSGWAAAFRGMRNSRQSWDNSDSIFEEETHAVVIGPKDLELASRLAVLGGSHAKFRRMIHVSMDISAPFYWWKQFETYKIGVTSNSTSTMYDITNKKFESDDFAMDSIMSAAFGVQMLSTINTLNGLRDGYIHASDVSERYSFWREIIQLVPESYKQLRTIDFNYEVISKIVAERNHHKLQEWNLFIREMKKLPYAKQLIFCERKVEDDKRC